MFIPLRGEEWKSSIFICIMKEVDAFSKRISSEKIF